MPYGEVLGESKRASLCRAMSCSRVVQCRQAEAPKHPHLLLLQLLQGVDLRDVTGFLLATSRSLAPSLALPGSDSDGAIFFFLCESSTARRLSPERLRGSGIRSSLSLVIPVMGTGL